jgi:branched-chain amino acid transport system substrate-binding protein
MKLSRRTLIAAAGSGLAVPAIHRSRAEDPIRIGVLYGLTGPGSETQKAALNGTKIATEQWNKAGGINGRQIELVVRDDKFSGAGTVAAARELNGTGINLIIGGSQTVMALALLPLVPELKLVVVAPSPAGIQITHGLYQPGFFRTTANVYTAYRGETQGVLKRYPDARNWAFIAPDGAFGHDNASVVTKAMRQFAPPDKPLTIQEPVFVKIDETDFKVIINNMMAVGVDAIFNSMVGSPAITFLQQSRSAGLTKRVQVIADIGNEFTIPKAMQRATPPNIWSYSYWVHDIEPYKSNSISQALYADYVAMTGDKYPPGMVSAGHRGALAMFNGIKKAGSTETEAVIRAMKGMSFETAGGPYKIRAEDNQGFGTLCIVQLAGTDTAPYFSVGDSFTFQEEEFADPPTPGVTFTL